MKILLVSAFIFTLYSCRQSITDRGFKWSEGIKRKIIDDSSKEPDSTKVDSSDEKVTVITSYFKGIELKHIRVDPNSRDTFSVAYLSRDQNFKLIRELCFLLKDESVEAIAYRGHLLGCHTFYYCNGYIKSRCFEFNNHKIGVEELYDSIGYLKYKIDHGFEKEIDSLIRNFQY